MRAFASGVHRWSTGGSYGPAPSSAVALCDELRAGSLIADWCERVCACRMAFQRQRALAIFCQDDKAGCQEKEPFHDSAVSEDPWTG